MRKQDALTVIKGRAVELRLLVETYIAAIDSGDSEDFDYDEHDKVRKLLNAPEDTWSDHYNRRYDID